MHADLEVGRLFRVYVLDGVGVAHTPPRYSIFALFLRHNTLL